ncbi:MAG: HEAT repeat domain-containing protein [Gemmatimonadetes bacterium]|nr:HEAT repeat domain-containing protein [Gemmatimonadota bacterium]
MSPALAIAMELARLVEAILLDQPDDVRERALGALLTAVLQGESATFVPRQLDLVVNDEVVDPAWPGVPELGAQLRGHEVATLTIGPDASPAELLAVAEQLAQEPRHGAAAHHFARALIGVGTGAISATYDTDPRLADILRPTPMSQATVEGGEAAETAPASLDELLAALEATRVPSEVARLIDELVPFAERGADRRDGRRIAELLARVFVARDRAEGDALRRMYTIGLRRIARGPILMHVVPLVKEGGEAAKVAIAALVGAGDLGAQLLVERLPIAEDRAERRALFNALVVLKPNPEVVRWLLTDPRWFVVRNGLDLAAELRASELEEAVVPLVRHDDERVRRSAVQAIGRFQTPRAVRAIEGALDDPAPQVRAKAAVSLGATRHPRATERLLAAIAEENDPEVLTALHVALAQMGTPEALAQLMEGAKPGGRIFGRKTSALRVAAVQGLSHAVAPEAKAALDVLADDKDPDVRAAAQRAKRPSRSMEAVTDVYFTP